MLFDFADDQQRKGRMVALLKEKSKVGMVRRSRKQHEPFDFLGLKRKRSSTQEGETKETKVPGA